ncbi:MAG: glutaminyl-peptide cyclotransferase [Bacteroidetes bacterium]|nr:glutaminyl-peptide cyclotransferase [Bacteroidota bacterium]
MRIIFNIILLFLVACNSKTNNKNEQIKITPQVNASIIHKYGLEIIDTLSHNVAYYTQGFVIHNGVLYEGTGHEGHSALIKYKKNKIDTDKIVNLDAHIFGEGVTVLNDKIYQISWLNQLCFVYDLSLKKEKEMTYSGEGWGLTNNDSFLIMSDGSATIRFIEPSNFTTIRSLTIKRENVPVRFINELELVDSLLYMNIYMTDLIMVANVNTGEIVAEIDISILRKHLRNNPTQEVSNGIAYDKKNDLFYLTGKNWNKIFIVRFHND